MRIALTHNHFDAAHLSAVKAEMVKLGALTRLHVDPSWVVPCKVVPL